MIRCLLPRCFVIMLLCCAARDHRLHAATQMRPFYMLCDNCWCNVACKFCEHAATSQDGKFGLGAGIKWPLCQKAFGNAANPTSGSTRPRNQIRRRSGQGPRQRGQSQSLFFTALLPYLEYKQGAIGRSEAALSATIEFVVCFCLFMQQNATMPTRVNE